MTKLRQILVYGHDAVTYAAVHNLPFVCVMDPAKKAEEGGDGVVTREPSHHLVTRFGAQNVWVSHLVPVRDGEERNTLTISITVG